MQDYLCSKEGSSGPAQASQIHVPMRFSLYSYFEILRNKSTDILSNDPCRSAYSVCEYTTVCECESTKYVCTLCFTAAWGDQNANKKSDVNILDEGWLDGPLLICVPPLSDARVRCSC